MSVRYCLPSSIVAEMEKKPHRYKRKAAVYRLIQADGTILYIGMSTNPPKRIAAHRSGPMGPLIAGVSVEWFRDTGSALSAEKEAIKANLPAGNRVHNPSQPPRRHGVEMKGLSSLRRIWAEASDAARSAFLDEITRNQSGSAA